MRGSLLPGIVSVYGIFLFRQAIIAVPNEMLDAGRIDGCSEFEIYLRLVMPLVRPMSAAFLPPTLSTSAIPTSLYHFTKSCFIIPQKIFLLHYDDYITGEEVIKRMEQRHFLPATLKEVLFLGKNNRDHLYLNDRRIVALGSTWFGHLHFYNVPLIRDFSGPYVDYQRLNERFSTLNSFAAVKQY